MKFFKNLCTFTKLFGGRPVICNELCNRPLWGYVAIAFNRVDIDRLQQVGPDRLCAEWILKNGGGISITNAPQLVIRNYNALPAEDFRFKIKSIDASGASIMQIGLDHFKNCNQIESVIFHQCQHLEPDGLQGIVHLKKSLKKLQISDCDNIADHSLLVVGEMKNLELLKMFDLRYVKDLEKVKQTLKNFIPNCNIDTNKPA